MKYIIQKIVHYSSINLVYVSSIVYYDIKYQKRKLLTYKEDILFY